MLTYKPLRTEFTANGFQFNQLHREGDLALFHKVAIPTAIHSKPFDAGFEIVVVSRHNGYELGGVKVEPAETYPSPEQWGSMGWTEKDLYHAEIRFGKLLKGEVNPTPEVPTVSVKTETPKVPQPYKGPELAFPEGSFSTTDVLEFNKVQYIVAHSFVKDQLAKGTIIVSGKRPAKGGKGKPSVLYKKA